MLQDKSYIRFAAENSVEVISMEEMEKALAEKGAMVRTYTSKDAYGDEVECLAEFPGLTIAQLERLSDGKAIEYMEGGKIPYTAIVNPHTLEPMEGMKGKKSSRELMDAVARHRKALEAEHGPGLPRKSWNELAEGQVAIDVALAAGDIPKAMKIARGLERLVERGHEHARRKAASSLRVVLSDAGERLDEAEQLRDAGKAKEAAEIAASLAPALQGTELQGRVEALRAKAKP
ncbi:MAG: hypothetical protein ACREID_06485 [Planctomycetota bacterium]